MKKTFGTIALLASSSLALVSPALAHDQSDNYGYHSQNYSNSYNQRNSYARGNRYVVARDNDDRHDDWRDRHAVQIRESVRDRQWERRDFGFRGCR